jgi:hypothetical protein
MSNIDINTKLWDMPDHARVWIYQSNRPFTEKEELVLKSQINGFVQEWAAHSLALTAMGDILYNQFIVLAVDEKKVDASGCSIDKSVRFLQDIENQYFINLFDRLNFAYLKDSTLNITPSATFKTLYTEGGITSDTLVFDNLVSTIGDLKNTWLKPLKESWHKRFV